MRSEDEGVNRAADAPLLDDDLADLYERAPCGLLSMAPDGTIIKVNETFLTWSGRPRDEVIGVRLPSLLTVGSRIYFETHVMPLGEMQGFVREISLDVLRTDASTFPILLNTAERRLTTDERVVRAVLLDATERRAYEDELRLARDRAEDALAEVHTLQGLLPMCSWCRKVRDDVGYWEELEHYVERQGGTRFTHGMCEDCYRSHVPAAPPDAGTTS